MARTATDGPWNSLKHWSGRVHYRVHVWNFETCEYEESSFFELREDAEAYERRKMAEGWRTSGVQKWKGRLPEDTS